MPAGPVQMAARRQSIIDAAEKLIRKSGSTDFTMAELARAAGVSRATTFNLFDSKLVLLYALLNRSLDGVYSVGEWASAEPDPFARVMHSAAEVSRFFIADGRFYRALYRVLIGANDFEHRPAYMQRAMGYWLRAIGGFEEQGAFSTDCTAEQIALDMLTFSLGLMDLWVHGEIDDPEFVARAAHGALTLTLGLARGNCHAHALGLLQGCRSKLSTRVRFQPQAARRQSVQERRARVETTARNGGARA